MVFLQNCRSGTLFFFFPLFLLLFPWFDPVIGSAHVGGRGARKPGAKHMPMLCSSVACLPRKLCACLCVCVGVKTKVARKHGGGGGAALQRRGGCLTSGARFGKPGTALAVCCPLLVTRSYLLLRQPADECRPSMAFRWAGPLQDHSGLVNECTDSALPRPRL